MSISTLFPEWIIIPAAIGAWMLMKTGFPTISWKRWLVVTAAAWLLPFGLGISLAPVFKTYLTFPFFFTGALLVFLFILNPAIKKSEP